jgi:hypothetical protein
MSDSSPQTMARVGLCIGLLFGGCIGAGIVQHHYASTLEDAVMNRCVGAQADMEPIQTDRQIAREHAAATCARILYPTPLGLSKGAHAAAEAYMKDHPKDAVGALLAAEAFDKQSAVGSGSR